MESAPLMPWLPIQLKSLPHLLLIHPQLLHHHLWHHRHHHRHLLLLHQVNVETSPIVLVMRRAAVYLNSMVFAWSMVAVHTRMPFAVPELSSAAQVIIPFVISKKGSVSRYKYTIDLWFQAICFGIGLHFTSIDYILTDCILLVLCSKASNKSPIARSNSLNSAYIGRRSYLFFQFLFCRTMEITWV